METKSEKLLEQLDEAKHLKEDIDRRGTNLSKILQKSLTDEEFSDYDYFINTKAKLIVDSREIADKIKLGEEQLNALKDTLVHSECWASWSLVRRRRLSLKFDIVEAVLISLNWNTF